MERKYVLFFRLKGSGVYGTPTYLCERTIGIQPLHLRVSFTIYRVIVETIVLLLRILLFRFFHVILLHTMLYCKVRQSLDDQFLGSETCTIGLIANVEGAGTDFGL